MVIYKPGFKNGGTPEQYLNEARKRFYKKIEINDDPVFGMDQPCWRWTGTHDDKGRPRFKIQRKSMNAKRMLLIFEGKTPEPGDCVIPICHQYDCVNPAHHVFGTKKESESVRDCQLAPHCQSILRSAYKAKEVTNSQIVDAFKISPHIVDVILDEWIPATLP